MTPRFIVFEGPEGAGKSTQIKLAERYLCRLGQGVKVFRDPGAPDAVGVSLRELLKHGAAVDGVSPNLKLSHAAELLGFLACRAHLVEAHIKPALAASNWVLCDRFDLSTMIYQGFIRNRNIADMADTAALGSVGLVPDEYLVLDANIDTLLSRVQSRRADDNEFDEEAAVRKGAQAYSSAASFLPTGRRVTIIDANKDVQQTHLHIKRALSYWFQ
jgi:dTMP kinase